MERQVLGLSSVQCLQRPVGAVHLSYSRSMDELGSAIKHARFAEA